MADTQSIVFVIFLIFTGAAVMSTVALYTRQSLLVAYIMLGMLLGPWGLGLVQNGEKISETGDVGIVFLLFLLGLHLHPQNLVGMLKKVSWIALISSFLFAAVGFLIPYCFGFGMADCVVIGAAMMFSSTIIGLKLLPTTVLHHQHTGELMISVLLMQDIIAIVVLLILQAGGGDALNVAHIVKVVLGFPLLISVSYFFQKYILIRLLEKFDKVQEYIFMVSIAWCLSMAQLAHLMGLSHEVGAFIAGVAIAAHPISLYIAESLKPLRDFFLVLFFFSIGASFNFGFLHQVIVPALLLAAFCMIFKPIIYRWLIHKADEPTHVAWEVGVRLGQSSEFSLLLVYLAASLNVISDQASFLVQAATIITFIVSCYWVVMKYPTPMALTDNMRRD